MKKSEIQATSSEQALGNLPPQKPEQTSLQKMNTINADSEVGADQQTLSLELSNVMRPAGGVDGSQEASPGYSLPRLNGTITWRTVLQHMELKALATGVNLPRARSRSTECISILVNNGCALSRVVDPSIVNRLARVAAGEIVDSLLLLEKPDRVKEAIEHLLVSYAECLAAEQPFASNEAPADAPTAVTPEPSSADSNDQIISAAGDSNVWALTCGPITYGQVIAAHQNIKVHAKTIQNQISSLRRLMELLGKDTTDDCQWMADAAKFEKQLSSVAVTDPSFRSALNKIRATACALAALENPANTLWESYLRAFHRHINLGGKAELMGKNQFILHCFNATGMSRRRLNAKRILVYQATFDRVASLERSLGAEGELTCWLINMSDDHAEKYQTAYGKRVSEAVRFEYGLQFEDWPDRLRREWADLYLLRTEPLKASRKWHLRLETVPKKRLHVWRIRKNDGACQSADNRKLELEWFFGWCLCPEVTLPNGSKNLWRSGPSMAITKDNLSLALLMDQDLFDGYLEFRKAHTLTEKEVLDGTQGTFNRSCNNFIEFTSSLLNPLTGFIYLRKDLYFRPADSSYSPQNLAPKVGFDFFNAQLNKKIHVDDEDQRWLYFCAEMRSYMELTRINTFDPLVLTRTRDPIANILALDDPMDAVVELLKKLEESEPVIEYWRHLHRKKRLFFMLMSVCPLRVLQFAFMSGRHLVKVQGKNLEPSFYRIKFGKYEFKNERFIREKDYSFDLPKEFTSFIDEYLAKDWPAINGRPFAEDERVFNSREATKGGTSHPKTRKQLNLCITRQLMKMCNQTTARHLGAKYKTPGFGPHSLRHIKGTSIIKVTGSYEAAALLLWDAVLTVRIAYAHVKRVEQLARVSREDYERMKLSMAKLQA